MRLEKIVKLLENKDPEGLKYLKHVLKYFPDFNFARLNWEKYNEQNKPFTSIS